MIDMRARHIIEALRSGISSREVGLCFSSARPKLLAELGNSLDHVKDGRRSGGMIVTGKYGEGKTHLLNTVYGMARSRNMVVSKVSLSKEAPFDKLFHVYPKLIQNTILPGRPQPGFLHVLEGLTPGHPVSAAMCEMALKDLRSNKLYFLLKSILGTEDMEEKYMLLADLEGDFVPNALLKQIYKRIYGEKVVWSEAFSKTKHMSDYFTFMSRLFQKLGYGGWVLLFDEAELIGRFSKKARLNAYKNIAAFLDEAIAPKTSFSLFAFNASFVPDVIDAKREYENLSESLFEPEDQETIRRTLDRIASAGQLTPLGDGEIADILRKICGFHALAYDWKPDIDLHSVLSSPEKRSFLLRTRIRAAVELLDQLYQYGAAGEVKIGRLRELSFDESSTPALDCLLEE